MGDPNLLTGLLRDVSRSFYLTLRILPRPVRSPIGLAYLLARATDTIADTRLVPVDRRMEALEQLRLYIGSNRSSTPPDLNFLAAQSAGPPGDAGESPSRASSAGEASPAELLLLGRIGEVVAGVHGLSAEDQSLIRIVLDTITGGQVLDLKRFAETKPGEIRALETNAELDDYLYRVAGCVGEFWTRICRAHLFPKARLSESFLLENGVRFGKGLQLTNILRDLPRDLQQGRCYLPRTELLAVGLAPQALLDSASEQQLRPVFDNHCRLALDHLRAGWEYTNQIPRGCARVRLACAWPILIGKRTLELLRKGRALSAAKPVKVPRKAVRAILLRSVVSYPWPQLWRGQWPENES
ncbi:MAG: squalene/phytoene synthase family protein [Verrucomicrobia bacterium]|nr:squalene/phytoene synthase family protein [Verrucomicrobiota bacterium]